MTPFRTYRVVYLLEDDGQLSVLCLDVDGSNSCGHSLTEARDMILDCIACCENREVDDVRATALLEERIVDWDTWTQLVDKRIARRDRART